MSTSRNCTCDNCGKTRIPEQRLMVDGVRVNTCPECRDPASARHCRTCKAWLPLDSFYSCTRDGQRFPSYTTECKDCFKTRQRLKKDDRRFAKYGIDRERYEELLAAQGGLCGGCRQPATEWHIDHDHGCCPQSEGICGQCVRGLLCRNCNLALGHAQDDIARLLGLADYLAGFRGNGSLPVDQATIARRIPTGTR